MDAADVILSKGQGNVETLYGCGYPIFYAFLVKCQRFQDLFGKEKLTPMFLEETGKRDKTQSFDPAGSSPCRVIAFAGKPPGRSE